MTTTRIYHRAPKGGLSYGGRQYKGGWFVPAAALLGSEGLAPICGGAPEPVGAVIEPEAPSIRIVVDSQYGGLSRGRHSARIGNGSAVIWADKDARGLLIITEPGTWQLHCSDGFSRSARAVLLVDEDGDWEITGDTHRFDVVED